MVSKAIDTREQGNLLSKAIGTLDKVGIFSRWTNVLGLLALFFMVCVTFVNVFMRYVFNSPIEWALGLTEVMMITALFLAIAYTYNEKGHMAVDIISTKLAPKPRLVLEFINNLLGLGVFVVVAWRSIVQALYAVQHSVVHSSSFQVPTAPFEGVIALGCITIALLVLRDLLSNIAEAQKQGLKPYHWVIMLGIPALIVAGAIIWMQPDLVQMSLPMVGLIGLLASLVFMLMGMPISFALILTSFLFVGHIRGLDNTLIMLGSEPYGTAGSYSWSVIPFFILLGFVCLFTRFGDDLFMAANRWVGHLPGGMAIAVIGACTGFAAIVGDSISATATMGSVSLPQMRKHGYSDVLSAGSIVGGATLGPIIPPSVSFAIVGLLTQLSIGDLFVAGIFPGLIMAFLFALAVYIWCRVNPSLGPRGERFGWKERFLSLKAGGPVVVLFLVIVGGIYMGVFTPTEGGAIGAVVALMIGLIMRRVTVKTSVNSLASTGKIFAAVFLILVGALMFTRFVAYCNLSSTTADLIKSLGLSPMVYTIIVLFIFLILGCFVSIAPLTLIGVPVTYPIAVSLGVNPMWFAVLVVLMINLGSLTPPVGINLFTMKGIAREIPMGVIYKGAIPFVFGTIVAIALVFAIPSLITWLPAALK